ncbi:MFS transporter [Rhodococcus sp. WS1]|uniref:MFS transporter n=1 Tax=unclassified Rhodococcus (in: high G+C Gram-positive bacteria) TaxID=192944 RepID=UPI0011426088|nr:MULTISPECIES: MFS transporter [unclassified Rhodococcus (in: high G+C Gram-positive bacteria)]ROZ52936.1 MFS transporter [Rhodococcus sp. WS1]TQC36026.1 MFS transporter [Rhodococcus sp. WS7]
MPDTQDSAITESPHVLEPATPSPHRPSEQHKPKLNRRVAFSSLVGTFVDGYDLVLYGLAAALVFPQVFFPALGEAAGIVASLGTLGVAFVARPFGAIICGHFGDRYGRKRTLVATLLAMGVSSTIIGLVPSAAQIGVAAPILVVMMRIVQGLAAGGEWGGSTSFVAEHAPPGQRGLYAMFPQLGHALPQTAASALFLVLGLTMNDDAFLSWGWRIPFVLSIGLIGIGLYIRLKVEETPVFKKAALHGTSTSPLLEAFKTQPLAMAKGVGVSLTMFVLFYLATSYLAVYGTNTLGFSRNQVLVVGLLAGVCYAVSTALSAIYSDRIGRRRLIGLGHIIGGLWIFLLFPILNSGLLVWYAVGICLTTTIAGIVHGPIAAFLPEQFHTRYRYSATGFTYSMTGVIGGGLVPLLAPIIIETAGTVAFGTFVAALLFAAAACTFSLRQTQEQNLDSV